MTSPKRKPAPQPSPAALLAELAAGPMFPELFADEPFSLRSQEATESPFVPSAAVQRTLPNMPEVDWEHVRRKHSRQRWHK